MPDKKQENEMKKEVTVNGHKFMVQHPGIRWYVNLTDRCKNHHGVLQQEKYYDELFENVVVKPTGVSLDSFGPGKDYSGKILTELSEEIENFLNS
jgi:hypothetical protein